MIREENGRKVIYCDRCSARLDLGPAAIAALRLRMPSGWIQDEPEHHLCPICSRALTDTLARRDQP